MIEISSRQFETAKAEIAALQAGFVSLVVAADLRSDGTADSTIRLLSAHSNIAIEQGQPSNHASTQRLLHRLKSALSIDA